MFLTATLRDDNGESVGVIVLAPKEFKSGRQGFFGQAKISLDGQRFQSQCQLVRIGEPERAATVEGEAGATGVET